MNTPWRTLQAEGALPALESILADVIAERAEYEAEGNRGHAEALALCAAKVSFEARRGSTCVPLQDLCGSTLGNETHHLTLPGHLDLQCAVSASRLCAVIPEGSSPLLDEEPTPLILDQGRMYLRRHWEVERRIATALQRRASIVLDDETSAAVSEARFLDVCGDGRVESPDGDSRLDAIDWQAVAASVAAERSLTVLLGGPGTGKTTTVAKILQLLQPRSVALAAPTGKAAARLTTSLRQQADARGLDPSRLIARTLHGLLEIDVRRDRFRRDRGRPLAEDLVIVDEASMIDTETFAALLDAVPERARLILIGDPAQLPSVGGGQVLRDISDAAGEEPGSVSLGSFGRRTGTPELAGLGTGSAPLSDSVVRLRKTYRFDPRTPLGALARAIHAGDSDAAIEVLRRDDPSARLLTVQESGGFVGLTDYEGWVEEIARAADAPTAFAAMSRAQILCAVREGPHGTQAYNDIFQRFARSRGPREPRIVGVNDHRLQIYNGDVGILLREGSESTLTFPGADGEMRALAPARVPPNESAFAITVHKSQGSEADEIVVVLPTRGSEVITRELLYTAVTRAKQRVRIAAREESLKTAIETVSRRSTGLAQRLEGRRGLGE